MWGDSTLLSGGKSIEKKYRERRNIDIVKWKKLFDHK